MDRQVVVILYVLAMVAVIVGVDVAFFRNRFWEHGRRPVVGSQRSLT